MYKSVLSSAEMKVKTVSLNYNRYQVVSSHMGPHVNPRQRSKAVGMALFIKLLVLEIKIEKQGIIQLVTWQKKPLSVNFRKLLNIVNSLIE